jgi:peptide/nickel transport system substrate-binding protein
MKNHELDHLRSSASEVENHYIDEYVAGRISRQRLLQLGTGIGMSVPLLGMFGTASALASPKSGASAKAGGTLRVGSLKAAIAIDPVTSNTQATLAATSITGEYLVYVSPATGQLKPEIATAWKSPDGKGKSWVFTIRQGVKFHDGSPLTADDVVATFKRLCDPTVASQALSVLKGLLAPDGITKTGPFEVTMTPVTPSPSLPFLIGSPLYNAVILPANYTVGSYEKTFPGTGPYKLTAYTSGVSATFVRNTAYWGGTPALDGVNLTFYADTASQIQALQGGELDLIPQFGYQEGQGLIKSKQFTIFSTKSSVHRELPMRVDVAPFNDKNVRVALALALNRPSIIKTLFGGEAVPGNDSPIAPSQAVYPKGVAQRKQNLAQAKKLAAGKKISTQLTTQNAYELPDLAVLVQNAAKAIGFTIKPKLLSVTAYYAGSGAKALPGKAGQFVPGGTPWLNAVFTGTDWAPRPVPNAILTAAYKTGGIWNASHYSNKALDTLINQFTTTADLGTQKSLAAKMQKIFLADTPVILPYFYNYLAAGKPSIKGYVADAVGLIRLQGVSMA